MPKSGEQAGDFDKVIVILDGAIKQFPENDGLLSQKWMVLLTKVHRDEQAYAVGRDLMVRFWDNSMQLNQIAWTVVDDKGVQTRDLKFAMKAAVRANELTESKDAAILDTLARVHYEKGDLAEAVRFQRMAVKNAGDDQLGGQIRDVLEKYKMESKEKDL